MTNTGNAATTKIMPIIIVVKTRKQLIIENSKFYRFLRGAKNPVIQLSTAFYINNFPLLQTIA